MTKVEIFRKNGNIIGYKASGHSGYSEQGSDIICSAISTSMQMTLAGIQEVLKLKVDFKIKELDKLENKIMVKVKKESIIINYYYFPYFFYVLISIIIYKLLLFCIR